MMLSAFKTVAIGRAMRVSYTILFYLMLPFIAIRLAWRNHQTADYKIRWSDRLGFSQLAPMANSIWIHATSVGETQAAAPLVRFLQHHYSNHPLLVTNTTSTGYAVSQQLFGNTVFHQYIPLDLPGAVKRFLKRFNPVFVIVMETELWPNLFNQCHRQGIPLLLANARLSDKSAKGYQRIRYLTQAMLRAIHLIAAQSESDAQRYIALGAAPQKVRVAGNLKFNVIISDELISAAKHFRSHFFQGDSRLVFLVASTHVGEEAIALNVFKRIRQQRSDIILFIVPRHPERFDEVERLCQRNGFKVARYSVETTCHASTDIVLGDTVGKLMLFYGVADMVFVGGSLMPQVGGHNLIEPALWGLPIITGPYLRNWLSVLTIFKSAQACVQIETEDEWVALVMDLLYNPARRKQLGEQAKKTVALHTQSLERHIDCIRGLFPAEAVS